MKGVNNESVARSKSNFCMQFPLAMIAVLNYNFNRKVKSGKCQLCCCENASASLCSGFLFEPDSLVPTPSVVQVDHALHQPPFVLSAPPQTPPTIGSFLIVCEDEREAFPTPSLIYGVIVQYKSINGMRVTLNVRKILKTHISVCFMVLRLLVNTDTGGIAADTLQRNHGLLTPNGFFYRTSL